jgi:beta-N-acetylhexosaminidase
VGTAAAAAVAVLAPASPVAAQQVIAPQVTAGTTPASVAQLAYARMTPAQRVGQLVMAMVPSTGSTSALRSKLAHYQVGNVVLIGQSHAGTTGVASVVAPVRRVTTDAGVKPYVAVDQEGGYVQHLKGSGFGSIPTALSQGRIAPTTLRADWGRWARQLRRAAVNLDLAPVGDVVPSRIGTSNQPIGRFYREYGHTPRVVAPHVGAVVRGIHDAGISATLKHFPGLGRATGNTDIAAGVTDPTRRDDSFLAPFRRAVEAGVPAVMVSTAIYPNIAPHKIGAFSYVIVTRMLRHDLGFSGIIVSDSLTTTSVRRYSYGGRATRSIHAGVDILLVTDNAAVGPMKSAIRARMKANPDFAARVKTAVLRVLTAKARAGLIPS